MPDTVRCGLVRSQAETALLEDLCIGPVWVPVSKLVLEQGEDSSRLLARYVRGSSALLPGCGAQHRPASVRTPRFRRRCCSPHHSALVSRRGLSTPRWLPAGWGSPCSAAAWMNLFLWMRDTVFVRLRHLHGRLSWTESVPMTGSCYRRISRLPT